MYDEKPNAPPMPGGLRKRLFAWMLSRIMRQYEEQIADRKRALFANLPARILEIGPGTGANLPYLPKGAEWIGVESNPYMERYLSAEASRLGVPVQYRHGTAERLEVEDESVDAVLCTLVLCSVGDPAAALAQIHRVLRPGGKFVFIEHVAAPSGTWLRRCQRVIRPVWRSIGDGCCPDRETWRAIDATPFASVELETFRMPRRAVPFFVAPHIAGTATK